MTGKPYIGVNNKAVIPRTIYAGVNNIARKVSAAYVGDENNRAKKIWPVSVLPNGFQQVEWIDFLTNKTSFLPYVGLVFQPRIVINFKTHSYTSVWPDSIGHLFGTQYEQISTDRNTSYYITAETINAGPNQPGFSLSNYKEVSGYTNYFGFRDYRTNNAEGLLTDSIYTLDFNNIKNGISNYYLYCDKGFYSVPRNNLLISHSKIDLSALRYDQSYQTSYFLLNSCPAGSAARDSYTAKIIFYNCAMYSNSGDTSGDMIHDYYPCYRKSDRQMGLYDLIDRIFLTPHYEVASSRPVENTDYILGPEV